MPDQLKRSPDALYDFDLALSALRLLTGRTRLEILAALAEEAADVHTLADLLELDVKLVSQHLRTLRASRAVDCRQERTRHVYALNGIVHVRREADGFELTLTPSGGGKIVISVPIRHA
jgi:DNA-binding transcriptional ArsR family regulator